MLFLLRTNFWKDQYPGGHYVKWNEKRMEPFLSRYINESSDCHVALHVFRYWWVYVYSKPFFYRIPAGVLWLGLQLDC